MPWSGARWSAGAAAGTQRDALVAGARAAAHRLARAARAGADRHALDGTSPGSACWAWAATTRCSTSRCRPARPERDADRRQLAAVDAAGRLLFYRERPAHASCSARLSLAGVLLVISRGSLAALREVHRCPAICSCCWPCCCGPATAGCWRGRRAHLRDARARPGTGPSSCSCRCCSAPPGPRSPPPPRAALASVSIHWTPAVAMALLYVAIGPSLIAYRAWGLGVATVRPTVATFFANLTPVFAGLLSAALLGEAPRCATRRRSRSSPRASWSRRSARADADQKVPGKRRRRAGCSARW